MSVSEPNTNIDLVRLVSDYVELNPVEYTRLAMVNRSFYTVFTSDRLWAGLDVYGKKTNIFCDFLARISGFEQQMSVCWDRESILYGLVDVLQPMDNKYVEFGCAVNAIKREWVFDLENISQEVFFSYFNLKIQRGPPSDFLGLMRYKEELLRCLRASLRFYENFTAICFSSSVKHHHCVHNFVKTQIPEFQWRHSGLSTLVQVMMAHPRLFYWDQLYISDAFNHQVLSILREVSQDRAALLLMIQGMPEFLNMLPEYWNDREFCLAALQIPWYYRRLVNSTWKFLDQSTDVEVLLAAMEALPDREHDFSETLLSEKSILIRALGLIKPRIYGKWISDGKGKHSRLWSDPDVIAAIIDGCSSNYSHYQQSVPIYDNERFEQLRDNGEWMKQRVSTRPVSWCLASDRLKQSRELLMLALDTTKKWKLQPQGFIKQHVSGYPLGPIRVPDVFHQDREVLRNIVAAIGIETLPKTLWTEELIKVHIDFNSSCQGLFPSRESSDYNLVCTAVLYDIKHLKTCTWALELFVKDPRMLSYINDHIHEVYFIISQNHQDVYKELFGETVPDKKLIDSNCAAELLSIDIQRFFNEHYSLDHDMAIEAAVSQRLQRFKSKQLIAKYP